MKYIFAFLLFPFLIFASEFTDTEPGDTISLIPSGDKISVLIFSDYNSCMVCNTNLLAFNDLKREFPQADISLLLNGSTPAFRGHVKKIYGLDFEVEKDHFEILKSAFKVTRLPVYFILKGNRILEYDKLGGVKLDEKDIFSIVRKNISPSDLNTDFTLIRKMPVTDDNGPVICGRFARGVYDPSDSVSYIIADRNDMVLKSGPGGVLTDILYLSKKLGSEIESVWDIYEIGSDSLAVSAMAEDKDTYSWYSLAFHKKLENISKVNFSRILGDVDFSNNFAYSGGAYLMAREFVRDTLSVLSHGKPFIRIEGNSRTFFGSYEKHFSDYSMARIFDGYIVNGSNGEMITYQEHGDNIQVYDKNDRRIKNIGLKFDSTMRFFRGDMHLKSGDTKGWTKFKNDYSRIDKMYSYNGRIYIVYENRYYPEGIYDSFSEKVAKSFYLHCSDMEGRSLYGRDLKLPRGFFLFRVEGDVVYGATVENNQLFVSSYRIRK